MKRSINGKIYNTDTAEFICDLPCHYYRSDFKWHDTSLYRTKKGTYFLAGEGGPMSMWSEPCGSGSWSGGSGIRVIGRDEALEYAEQAGLEPEEMIDAGFELQEG